MEGLLRKKNVTMGLIGILSMLMGIFFVSFCVHDTEEYARNRMVENQLFSWGVLSNRNIVTYVNSQGMDIYDDKYLFQGSTSKLKTGNFKKANIITTLYKNSCYGITISIKINITKSIWSIFIHTKI